MEIYKVTAIEEADYGCEECALGPKALVTFLCADNTVKKAEITEDWLAYTGIDVGKNVVWGADGKYRPVTKVAAAVILSEENGIKKIFATRRGYGEYKGKWEFPGGKTEAGETAKTALVREIKEELDTLIKVGEHIYTIQYDYPKFHLTMDCFFAEVAEGKLTLSEHTAAKWLTKETLYSVDWLPADLSLIEKLKEML
ncbi:MAG: (deoxy)nucleoside triphosphate pyrophosphohydrolase [Firmicutes bacterium]|nr:(deoxy)nucleoside triphosphate pyrophosphohydrolase [Bacillota bacterium]